MRVWVDLTNSPHALFLAPIARALTEQGADVLVTARSFAHTIELAQQRFERVHAVGSGERKALSGKVRSLGDRVRELIPVVEDFRPDVAVAHGSYDQPITARLLGIPSLTMVDYEFHPGTHLLFRLASRLLLPEAFSPALVRSHGGLGKTWRYHGLKEEVYLADFRPDPSQVSGFGFGELPSRLVTVRPPAVGAMYHRDENPLWWTLIGHLRDQPNVLTVILPRHPAQVEPLRADCAADNVLVVDHPVDGPALIWWSSAVISAGGTMNREAVVLGTPVWSMFTGRLGSVDRALIDAGRMHLLSSPHQVADLTIPDSRHRLTDFTSPADHDVLGQVLRAIERTARIPRRRLLPRGAPADDGTGFSAETVADP